MDELPVVVWLSGKAYAPPCFPLSFYCCSRNVPIWFLKVLQFCLSHLKKKNLKNLPFIQINFCSKLFLLRISTKRTEADDFSQNQNLLVKRDQTHKELITLALIKCSCLKRKKREAAACFILARRL